MSVIRALARLLDASYLDAAPTDDQRDAWREAVSIARGEHDRLHSTLAARDAELAEVRRERDFLATEKQMPRYTNAQADLEVERHEHAVTKDQARAVVRRCVEALERVADFGCEHPDHRRDECDPEEPCAQHRTGDAINKAHAAALAFLGDE